MCIRLYSSAARKVSTRAGLSVRDEASGMRPRRGTTIVGMGEGGAICMLPLSPARSEPMYIAIDGCAVEGGLSVACPCTRAKSSTSVALRIPTSSRRPSRVITNVFSSALGFSA
jgi:hypothetical protein